MRLKLYEEYSPELYQKIDSDHEYNKIYQYVTSISDREVKIISDKFNIPRSSPGKLEYDLVKIKLYKTGLLGDNLSEVIITAMVIFVKYGKFANVKYTIKKTTDEWFLITESCEELTIYQQYKCDQLEGVISFLNKKIYDRVNEEYSIELSDDAYYKEITFDEYTTTIYDNVKVSMLADRPAFDKIKDNFNEKLKDNYKNMNYNHSLAWGYEKDFWSKTELSIIHTRRSVEIRLDLYKREEVSLNPNATESIDVKKSAPIFLISKVNDEWYYVIEYGSYDVYKCDQIDGVTKCLYNVIDTLLKKIDAGNEKTINLLKFTY